jgi:hypothetical protein
MPIANGEVFIKIYKTTQENFSQPEAYYIILSKMLSYLEKEHVFCHVVAPDTT